MKSFSDNDLATRVFRETVGLPEDGSGDTPEDAKNLRVQMETLESNPFGILGRKLYRNLMKQWPKPGDYSWLYEPGAAKTTSIEEFNARSESRAQKNADPDCNVPEPKVGLASYEEAVNRIKGYTVPRSMVSQKLSSSFIDVGVTSRAQKSVLHPDVKTGNEIPSSLRGTSYSVSKSSLLIADYLDHTQKNHEKIRVLIELKDFRPLAFDKRVAEIVKANVLSEQQYYSGVVETLDQVIKIFQYREEHKPRGFVETLKYHFTHLVKGASARAQRRVQWHLEKQRDAKLTLKGSAGNDLDYCFKATRHGLSLQKQMQSVLSQPVVIFDVDYIGNVEPKVTAEKMANQLISMNLVEEAVSIVEPLKEIVRQQARIH